MVLFCSVRFELFFSVAIDVSLRKACKLFYLVTLTAKFSIFGLHGFDGVPIAVL